LRIGEAIAETMQSELCGSLPFCGRSALTFALHRDRWKSA
jgi:hypothetical protein